MEKLVLRERWAPWWLGAIIAIPFSLIAVTGYLPAIAILGYWLVALVFNRQSATISPAGVRVTQVPFPVGSGRSAPRAEIAYIYISHARIKKRGAVVEEYHTMGVATHKGDQVDLQGAYPSADAALHAARQVQAILPFPIHTAPAPPFHFRGPALLWVSFCMVVAIVAVYVELSAAP